MALVTSQQLNVYYDLYRSIEVTLNKEVSKLLGFLQEHVYLKILGTQWPCVLYSTSLEGAKIILNLKPAQMEKLRSGSNLGQLRYGFKLLDKIEPMAFYVNVKVKGYNRYNNATNNDLYFMTLEFSQRPPDDLIEILGTFLEANVNSHKRKEERIPVNEQIIQQIGFVSCHSLVTVDSIDRKCLIRDISFGGSKLLIPGLAKFLEGKTAVLRLVIDDPRSVLEVPGTFVRVEPVDGRKDITQVAMQFKEDSVPMAFKMKINEFLKQLTKKAAMMPQTAKAEAKPENKEKA